jgi:predicted nucleic acid-binding protein
MASSPLRVVIDTNVFVSGTILSRGTPFEVLEARNLKQYQGIDILSPYAFLERLARLITE